MKLDEFFLERKKKTMSLYEKLLSNKCIFQGLFGLINLSLSTDTNFASMFERTSENNL